MNQVNCNTENKKGKHLCLAERKEIEKARERGFGVRQIARALNRNPSSISREIKRGSVQQRKSIKSHSIKLNIPLEVSEHKYFADVGQRIAKENTGRRGGKYKLFEDMHLLRYIEDKILKDHWSPDAVVGWIKLNGITFMTSVCTKTIYNYIDRGQLAVKNIDLLLKTRLKVKKRHTTKHKRVLGNSIDLRPKEIDHRQEFGHFEGDSVVGKEGKSAVLTLVERKTRKGFILALKDRSSKAVMDALKYFSQILPSGAIKSITFDNGSEFSQCHRLDNEQTKIYYAHPYSAYERGSNENYNGIIRRHIPKGKDLSRFTQADLNRISNLIDSLPRRRLNYKNAEMLFAAELENYPNSLARELG